MPVCHGPITLLGWTYVDELLLVTGTSHDIYQHHAHHIHHRSNATALSHTMHPLSFPLPGFIDPCIPGQGSPNLVFCGVAQISF